MSAALHVLLDSLSCSRVLRVAYSSLVRVANLWFFYYCNFSIPAVYLRHWYPLLIRGWCDLGSACAQPDQSLNFMLMIFWNSWIDVCKRRIWSVCSALIQYKNPAGTWRQNDIILTYIRRHYVTYLSVRRCYDVICLLGRFNAHFAEIHNQTILITQARDLNL